MIACDPLAGADTDPILDPSHNQGGDGACVDPLVQGAVAACQIIDEICDRGEFDDEYACVPSSEGVQRLHAVAGIVRKALAVAGSCNRTRPSAKLPGWGTFIECCFEVSSNLGKASEEYANVIVVRITNKILIGHVWKQFNRQRT